jgi:hypothetical protein
MKLEYKALHLVEHMIKNEKFLNQHGQENWELVTVLDNDDETWTAFMKRPIQSDTPMNPTPPAQRIKSVPRNTER